MSIEHEEVPLRGRDTPAHINEVRRALEAAAPEIDRLWNENGIDSRKVAKALAKGLPSWEMERVGSPQGLTWEGSLTRPIYVDGQRGGGRSIVEIEGGGALQNNRLHRDLLAALLLDDVRELVLVLPTWVHGRNVFDYAHSFAKRLREKKLLDPSTTVTIFGYGSPPHRAQRKPAG